MKSSLRKLESPSCPYEVKLQQHVAEWGVRVRTALESAILGVSGSGRGVGKEVVEWGEMVEELRSVVG